MSDDFENPFDTTDPATALPNLISEFTQCVSITCGMIRMLLAYDDEMITKTLEETPSAYRFQISWVEKTYARIHPESLKMAATAPESWRKMAVDLHVEVFKWSTEGWDLCLDTDVAKPDSENPILCMKEVSEEEVKAWSDRGTELFLRTGVVLHALYSLLSPKTVVPPDYSLEGQPTDGAPRATAHESSKEEWLVPPTSLAELGRRLSCSADDARITLKPHGLKTIMLEDHGLKENRQRWTCLLNGMPNHLRAKIEKPSNIKN